MTTFSEMRTWRTAIETNAELAEKIASDMERNQSDLPPWEALRYLANTMRSAARDMAVALQ